MTTTEINYKGEGYTCRIVKSNDGEDLIIAGTRLLDAIMPYPITDSCNGFADREAEKVDDKIFFYTSDSDFRVPDMYCFIEGAEWADANPPEGWNKFSDDSMPKKGDVVALAVINEEMKVASYELMNLTRL